MELLREVVESFVRLVKSEVDPGAVVVCSDDMFEVTKTPSVVLQGPTLLEDSARRTQAKQVRKDQDGLSYEERRHPRLYHLEFDVIVTTGKESDLLDLTEKISRFYQLHPVLEVGDHGALNITELTPLGGLKRVNLSNLRQLCGKCRIEDCPVYDGRVVDRKARDRIETGTEYIGEHLMKLNIKNLLFQPLALHLATDGEGLHLSARECPGRYLRSMFPRKYGLPPRAGLSRSSARSMTVVEPRLKARRPSIRAARSAGRKERSNDIISLARGLHPRDRFQLLREADINVGLRNDWDR